MTPWAGFMALGVTFKARCHLRSVPLLGPGSLLVCQQEQAQANLTWFLSHPLSWYQGGMMIQHPLLTTRSAVQPLPSHVVLAQGSQKDAERAVYSPISSYLITVPRLAFSSGEGKRKTDAGAWSWGRGWEEGWGWHQN